jgi:hypothetical protein
MIDIQDINAQYRMCSARKIIDLSFFLSFLLSDEVIIGSHFKKEDNGCVCF